MQTFDLNIVLTERSRVGKPWLEFLRAASLSMGVYHLKAGADDPQRPHTEDEVYYIVAGQGKLRVGGQVQDVRPGTILFVERLTEHRFCEITEDLTALVFFAPAEGSLHGGEMAGNS
ncbi:MAG TPA: cupin domain-containing protein [Gemmataceae bacterium]|nr:cupin domain-containing protein [Gemmataceae bacterium]